MSSVKIKNKISQVFGTEWTHREFRPDDLPSHQPLQDPRWPLLSWWTPPPIPAHCLQHTACFPSLTCASCCFPDIPRPGVAHPIYSRHSSLQDTHTFTPTLSHAEHQSEWLPPFVTILQPQRSLSPDAPRPLQALPLLLSRLLVFTTGCFSVWPMLPPAKVRTMVQGCIMTFRGPRHSCLCGLPPLQKNIKNQNLQLYWYQD